MQKTLLLLFAVISSSGCYVAAPKLPAVVNIACADARQGAPIPERMRIDITPDEVRADAGGKAFIREYARMREALARCAKPSAV